MCDNDWTRGSVVLTNGELRAGEQLIRWPLPPDLECSPKVVYRNDAIIDAWFPSRTTGSGAAPEESPVV
jgi:hypothetical protein